MTQVVATLAVLAATLLGQETDYQVYAEAPRLLLTPRRLKLLKRERERESLRWQQFDAFMTGKARMAEPGFALALWGTVTGRLDACRQAGEWAQKTANPKVPGELRQMALVYDWCQGALGESGAGLLARRMVPVLQERPSTAAGVNARVAVAMALAEAEEKGSQEFLKWAAEGWWKSSILPKLQAGENPFQKREDLYGMVELLHTVRDNLRVDLREGAGEWFEQLAPFQVLGYYPQPWPAPENEYRVPAYLGKGDPDLREAALSRAAELALVAYDTNAQPHQFLQGWLMQDRFLMRGDFGIPYELLWANPYLPGLSYSYMPDLFHGRGQLFARAGWEEDTTWLGYWGGQVQVFEKGQRSSVRVDGRKTAVGLGPVKVFFAATPAQARLETGWLPPPEEGAHAVDEAGFVLGLEPKARYDVEVDDEEMYEAWTDVGGILELKFKPGRKAGVRVRKSAQ